MDPTLKPARRPWAPREIVMLLVMVALAVALFLEHRARQAGDLEAQAQASRRADQERSVVSSHQDAAEKFRLETEKKLDELKSRVMDLENDRKKAGH
jgi:hypothetical protein